MSVEPPSTTTTTTTTREPELYVRGEISQNAKGEYRMLTTASVTLHGTLEALEDLFRETLQMADNVARAEIARRQQID